MIMIMAALKPVSKLGWEEFGLPLVGDVLVSLVDGWCPVEEVCSHL